MQHGGGQRAENAALRLASGPLTLLLAIVLLPALAAAPAPKATARLQSLQIDIWPEYDRPAALVILRAELAQDVALPAESSDFPVQPDLKDVSTGPDGLRYRSAQLGAFNSGKAFPIEIRYTKNDARTSAEILKPSGATAAAAPEPTTDPQRGASSQLLLALRASS